MESKSSSDLEERVFQHPRIHSAEYSRSTRTLKIRFGASRREYAYQVPPELWEQFKDNPHPNAFVRTTIQPFFKAKETSHDDH